MTASRPGPSSAGGAPHRPKPTQSPALPRGAWRENGAHGTNGINGMTGVAASPVQISFRVRAGGFQGFGGMPQLALTAAKPWMPLGGPSPMPMMEPVEMVVPQTKAEWIEVDDSSELVQHGFPSVGAALMHHSTMQDLFSSASYILYELAGEAMSSMTLTHDWEWNEYPYIAEALRRAGAVEYPYALATITLAPNKRKWAVGLATNGKHRQQTVKLSLALALAADADSLQEVIRNHPGFRELCEASGIFTGDARGPPADAVLLGPPRNFGRKRRRKWDDAPPPRMLPAPPPRPEGVEAPRSCGYKTELCRGDACPFAHGEEELRAPGEVKQEHVEAFKPAQISNGHAAADPGPGDECFWIELEPSEALPKELEGLPMEALVCSTNNYKRSTCSVDNILSGILGDEVKELRFIDDSEWKNLPTVGAALKKRMAKEECFTAAFCPTRSLWAVGVGMKGQTRWRAARLAICVAVALQQEEILEEPPDLSDYPNVLQMVKQAGEEKKKMLN
ncbi:unnamed protein product [Effrenium voratum]|uniref:C3H1-type domain-containing protein n=1 Tax=Effrenium voratum TaxID=2562239 RepID=A0AA36N4U5_9DINO|nr:unnamed protein product [Effrenium voratum]